MIKENNLSIIKSIVKKYSLGHTLIIEVNKDGVLNLIIMVKLVGYTPLYYLELMRQEIEQVIKLSVYIFIYGFPRLKVHRQMVYVRFIQAVLNKFYKIAFRKNIYRSVEQLQEDLDFFMLQYNEERTHQGKRCKGRTPMQTFLDSLHLAREKMIQETAAGNTL